MSSGLMRRQCRVCAYIYARGEKPGDETSSSTLQMTVRSGFSSRRPVAYPTQVGGYVKVAPSGSAKRSLRPSALVRCQGLAAGPRDGPAHQPLDPQGAQFATSAMDRVAERRPAVVLAVRLTAGGRVARVFRVARCRRRQPAATIACGDAARQHLTQRRRELAGLGSPALEGLARVLAWRPVERSLQRHS